MCIRALRGIRLLFWLYFFGVRVSSSGRNRRMYEAILPLFYEYLDANRFATEHQLLAFAAKYCLLSMPSPPACPTDHADPFDPWQTGAVVPPDPTDGPWYYQHEPMIVTDPSSRASALQHAIEVGDLVRLKCADLPRRFTASKPRFAACVAPLHLRAEELGPKALHDLGCQVLRSSRWVFCRPEMQKVLKRHRDIHQQQLATRRDNAVPTALESTLMLGEFWCEFERSLRPPFGQYVLKLTDSTTFAECMHMSWHETARRTKLRCIWPGHASSITGDLTAFTFRAVPLPRHIAVSVLRQVNRAERSSKDTRRRIIDETLIPHCPSFLKLPDICHLFFS